MWCKCARVHFPAQASTEVTKSGEEAEAVELEVAMLLLLQLIPVWHQQEYQNGYIP
jgi:hypothetical protein